MLLSANRLAFTKCLSGLLCFETELLANVDSIPQVHKVRYVTMLQEALRGLLVVP